MHFLHLPWKHLIFVLPAEAQVSCLVPRRVLADWRATGSWYYGKGVHPFQRPCVNAQRSHGSLRDTLARSRVFRFPNTLETPRNEADKSPRPAQTQAQTYKKARDHSVTQHDS